MARVSRRQLLAAGGAAALAGTVLGQTASAQRSPRSPWNFQVEVAPDLTSMSTVREPATGQQFATGPFYATGPIYGAGGLAGDGTARATAKRIGTFRIQGWTYDGRAALNLGTVSFDITGRGEIIAIGAGPGTTAAIVGGSGEFNNVVGQVFIYWINQANFAFRAAFDVGTATGNLNE